MADYCTLLDCVDPILRIEQRHIDAGNTFVDAALHNVGINHGSVVLPQPLLTQIAGTYAKIQSATEGVVQEDSTLIKKAELLEKNLKLLVGQISKDALGISTSSDTDSGFGAFELFRG